MLKDAIKRRQPGFNESYWLRGLRQPARRSPGPRAAGGGAGREIRHLRDPCRRPAEGRAGGGRAGRPRGGTACRGAGSRNPSPVAAQRPRWAQGRPGARNRWPKSRLSLSSKPALRPRLKSRPKPNPLKQGEAPRGGAPPRPRRRRPPTRAAAEPVFEAPPAGSPAAAPKRPAAAEEGRQKLEVVEALLAAEAPMPTLHPKNP